MKSEVKIPFHLSKQDRDKRGLPIPWIVFRDKEGTPHFTINDQAALIMALAQKLCGLCGRPHKLGNMWFIGGPGAAFHERGLYIDPPVHEECGRYAMRVCPFIAAPNYSTRIDAKTLDPNKQGDTAVLMDSGMDPSRPAMFVFARASGYKLIEVDPELPQKYIQPRRPWKEVEFWLQGQQIKMPQASAIQRVHAVNKSGMQPEELLWWPRSTNSAQEQTP